MKIRDFLREHFKKRLSRTGCLVLYDPERRYFEIAQLMNLEGRAVIDCSVSTILGRERAMDAWRRLADSSDPLQSMILYLPVRKPKSETEIQRNPYQAFALGGSEFPEGDGDSYHALCRQAKPGFTDKIDGLFSGGIPDFDTVDAVDGGQNWPKLTSLLKVVSPAEILIVFLSPSDAQREVLEADDAWQVEFHNFADISLGLKVKTKSQKWKPIREELARYLLFSEFALALPEPLPEELQNVPRASASCVVLIYNVCETLRGTEKHQDTYIELANRVSSELNLEQRLKHVADFGARDTFSFEERTFLSRYVSAAEIGDFDKARKISRVRKGSIWVSREAERQLLWTIAERSLELIAAVTLRESAWKKNGISLSDLFSLYTDDLRKLDTLHRGLEKAVNDLLGDQEIVAGLVEKGRKKYIGLTEKIQSLFISLVESEGWPPTGILKHTQVFDKFLAPALDARERVAFILIDALRFELGMELRERLSGDFQVEIHAAAAQLPTITRVGMAALLPKTDGNLVVTRKEHEAVPEINGEQVMEPKDRLKVIQKTYGDRCAILGLTEFLKNKKLKIEEKVQLLLLKAQTIDELGEHFAHDAASLITEELKKLPAAVAKLRQYGFEQVIMATDHGFILLAEQEPGDVVGKAPGDWVIQKDRFLLGSGSGTPGAAVFETAHVGIISKMENLAVPRSFGTFSKCEPYYHGGLSLQECVLPVLQVRVPKKKQKAQQPGKLLLIYKGGRTGLITSRRPMIEIILHKEHMYAQDWLEFSLEAYCGDKLVGEAASCDYLNPATNLIRIQFGQAIKVPLRIDDNFEGPFEVRAVDLGTQANYAVLKLKTNFMDI